MILVLYFVTDNIGHLLKTYISLAQATFCARHLLLPVTLSFSLAIYPLSLLHDL